MDKIDTHIHGQFSSDSKQDYRKLCKKAIEKNYKAIAFTEHFDLLDSDPQNYVVPVLKKYMDCLTKIQNEFPGLKIIKGIELGEPHRIVTVAKKVFSDIKIDYIIGSLHFTKTRICVSDKTNNLMTERDLRQYYEETLEMVEAGNFDTLGHLSIYKRSLFYQQLPSGKKVQHIIDEIFKVMIKKNICLEINNSSFEINCPTFLPDPIYLARYKELGGELITIGSDAHDLELFDKYYEKTLVSLRELGFSRLYYKCNGAWDEVLV
ncbi:MAG: histidinol-phosphatase HisJ family protein [Fibromonadaceae bacterium]|jgi:histidinol-phosphatase (PHP family)|nr:histidinol-phosphatase HisJ family protein [Fibromonadaceae bacterium]